MKIIKIGRLSTNDICVDDPLVSKSHCQIIQENDGGFTLTDVGSTNGTYVNGIKRHGQVKLNPNDIIRVGNSTLPWQSYFLGGNDYPPPGGTEIDDNDGSNQPPMAVRAGNNQLNIMEKKRHGFVTFWMWFGIIGNVIAIPFAIVTYQNMTNLGYLGMELIMAGIDITPFSEAVDIHVLFWQIIAAVSGICMIIFYSKLLKWQKSGFWGIIVTAVIVALVNVVMISLIKQDYELVGLSYDINPIIQIITTPLSLLLLWGILQIKKDGVSCWKQLD